MSTIRRARRRRPVKVGVSRGTSTESIKAGAEPEAGTANAALRQAVTGHMGESGILGTKSSTALEGESMVFELLMTMRRPLLHRRMSFRRRVCGPPHSPGRGDSRFDCRRKAKYPIRIAAIGISVEGPSIMRKLITARKALGVRGGEGETM